MQLIDFIDKMDLNRKNEAERAKLLCFFFYKENKQVNFKISEIAEILVHSGYSYPNTSRLKNKLLKGQTKAMLLSNDKLSLEFIPTVLQNLEKNLGGMWKDSETIISCSELIDETKFCGKRNYLDKLIKQINSSYKSNCFDACAVLMRRLFEILIILSFQNFNIDEEIKGADGNYIELKALVKKIQNSNVLKIGRIGKDFDSIREIGNYSAHGFTYTAGKKDIDDINLKYRVMLDELYDRAGLI